MKTVFIVYSDRTVGGVIGVFTTLKKAKQGGNEHSKSQGGGAVDWGKKAGANDRWQYTIKERELNTVYAPEDKS